MKRTIIIFIICIISFFVLSCGYDDKEASFFVEDTDPAYGDTIIIGSIGDATSLLPIIASDSSSFDIADYVYNGLVKYDKDYNIVGDLAESWEISEDNLTIIFHLRDDVTWHDGAPFTSEDVMFTYELLIDENTPTAYAGDYLLVKEVSAPDPYTFIVNNESCGWA